MGSRERIVADLGAFVAAVGRAGAPGSHALELPGVVASVVPVAPERPLMNGVVYEEAAALTAALPELARAYARAGVRAWTVWVPPGEREGPRALASAGHALDASPAAMELDLGAARLPEPGDLAWEETRAAGELAAINDASYPFPGTPFADSIRDLGPMRGWLARLDGRPASAVATLERGDSVGVYLVATLAEARGRGLMSRLLGVALAAAREAGARVATLQATRVGEPLYARLGFRSLGPYEMWERRTG